MRIKKAQPIFIEGNDIAVLLLHSFTSHTRDMKALAESIHQSFGFSCFVPLFSGHGQEAEALIPSTIDDWWEDALGSYEDFQQFIYETMDGLGEIIALIAIYYGGRDEAVYEESALEIAESVSSAKIDLKKIVNSSHLMTLSKEKDSLYE